MVKAKNINNFMITKRKYMPFQGPCSETLGSENTNGFNEAIQQQGERELTLNRDRLDQILYDLSCSEGMKAYPWQHVSVSILNQCRCPTWEEMCHIKDLFWNEDEAVIQIHPAKCDYVNNHKYCLHLWKPIYKPLNLPPSILVGYK